MATSFRLVSYYKLPRDVMNHPLGFWRHFEQRLTRSSTLAAKRTFRMPGLLEGDNGTIIDGAWAAKHAAINAVFFEKSQF
jgi:hypothetical protein